MQGYLDALEKYDIPFDDDLIVDCTNSYKRNDVILKDMFKKLKPDGVFTSVERLAFATYYACYDLNLSIPQQVKVVGFSSLQIAPLLNPSLTTVTQPSTQIGVEAASLLFKMLAAPEQVNNSETVVLDSKLIKRNSTAKS